MAGSESDVRVMMVLHDLRSGGAEVSALQLVRALSPRGYQFTIVSVADDGQLADAYARAGAEVHAGLISRLGDLRALLRIARLLSRRRIDVMIVVDVTRQALFYGLVSSLSRGWWLRRVIWCKSVPGSGHDRYVASLRKYSRAGLVDVVICPSWWQRGRLVAQGVRPSRIGLIRNGVEPAKSSPPAAASLHAPQGRKLIVQVAHVQPDKDFDTLLAAGAQLSHVREDFHLALIGKGTDSVEMASRIGRLGLAGRVSLLGHIDDVRGILAEAYAFVLSSNGEVFSVATLEAMASGLPVVVSDLPTFSEIFTSGREGFKFTPGDEDELAQTLSRLLDDGELRARMSSAARRRAERFSLTRMADNWDRLLRTLARK